MKFDITIPKDEINKAQKDIVSQASSQVTVPGFRKGKAPKDIAQKQLDQSKIQEEIINRLLPATYIAYVKKHKLTPIGQPNIKAKKIVPDQDWEFEVEIAEPPEVKLNEYQAQIKKKVKPAKKTKKHKKDEQVDPESRLMTQIFNTLLEECQVEIPQILIDQEANHKLSHLVEQVDKLGLSIQDYAKSVNKDVESIKKEYQKASEERLQLEFILEEIAQKEKLEADDNQVDKFLDGMEDKNTADQVKNDPKQRENLKYSLTRQNVIDHLKSLPKK